MRILGVKPLAFLIVLLALIALPAGLPNAQASTVIAFDATANTNCAFPTCTATLSWSHTIGTGSNRILIVGVSDVPTKTVSTVTYGGTQLTLVAAQNDATDEARVELWYLLSPSTGTASVTVTFSATPSSAVGGSVSYFNVAGIGNFNTADGSTNPASVTVNANSGDLVVDTVTALCHSVASPAPGAGQTQRWDACVSANNLFVGMSDKPASSPVTMSWSPLVVVTSSDWALIGVDLQPAPVTQPAVHPLNVGGEMLPVNLFQVLGPWIAVMLALTVVAVETLVIRRRKNR